MGSVTATQRQQKAWRRRNDNGNRDDGDNGDDGDDGDDRDDGDDDGDGDGDDGDGNGWRDGDGRRDGDTTVTAVSSEREMTARDARWRRCNKRWRNNQPSKRTRGKWEAEAQADKRRRGDNEEGHVVLLSGGGGFAVPTGANGDTQGILRRRVRPTGDGDGRMRRGVIPLLLL
jgi:hypothetical protein